MRHNRNNTGLFRRTIAILITACMLTSGFSPSALAQTPDTTQADVAYTEGDMQNESSPQAPPENVTESEPGADPESSHPESSSPESSSPESSSPESSSPESSSPESSSPGSSSPESSHPESSMPENNLPGSELREPVSNAIDGQANWPVFINKTISAEIVGGQLATIDYNKPITLSLEGYSGTGVPEFFYQAYTAGGPDENSWQAWTLDLTLNPGQYYLGWQDETYSYAGGDYGIEIVPVALNAPANPKWNAGSTASWDTVTTDKNGAALKADAVTGYAVSLYKGADAVATATVESSATTYDFKEKLSESGAGTYTYTVQAVASTDASACYTSSAASTASTATHLVAVTLEGDAGIASVTPASFLLLQGKSASISATPKESFTFGSWNCPAGMTVTGDSTATLAIAEEYSGSTEVTITASTTTITAPTVTDYAAGMGDQYGTLLATAQDTASGITAYAFSTAGTAEAVGASEWKTADPKPNEPASFTHKVAAPGNYYFYAKNAYGNAVKSGSFIQATQVTYKGYGAVSDQAVYLLGDQPLTLTRPTRAGFAFGGWYRSAGTTGTAITELGQADHSTSPILLYAKWTREPVTITQHPQPLTMRYDGQPHELGVTVSNTTGEIAYQWYKDNIAIPGATARTYMVKDVKDSGSYHVVVTVTAEANSLTATSTPAAVAITQAPLTVKADDITMKHGEAPPAYKVSYEGFKGADNATNSNLTAGTITCSYKLGDDAKEYDIIPSGFAAPNYTITHTKGTLTVQAKTVEEAGLTAALSQTSYTYTGAAFTPSVTVNEGEKTLAADTDYTVAYRDNTNVGTAKVTITLQGNYKGVINLTFEIAMATFTPTVSLADWIYGDTAKMPQVNGNTSGGAITYHYAKADGTVLTQKPTNAGSYTVYAVVAPTANYDGVTTEKVTFTIKKRPITLTAPTQRWVYDGNSHSAANYTMTGDFAGSDSFLSVAVTGQITNVGEVENVVTYTLPSSTNADNYQITCTNGTLTVTAQTLTVPVDHRWVSTTPGLASWVAVTRNDLDVQYEVKLYRAGVDGSNATFVATETATGNEHDFKAAIKQDTTTNGSAGYYFTVRAIPAGGANKDNYTGSAPSQTSANIYTMQVSVKKTAGIDSVTIGGTDDAVLLQGESAVITATAATGYALSKSIWTTDAAGAQLSFGDATKATTTVRVSAALAAPCDAEIWASAEDEKPVIKTFTAQANADHNEVTFTLNAQDTLAVTGWMITTSDTAPERDDAGWQTVNVTELEVTDEKVTAQGTYYAWIRDDRYVVGAEAPIAVYEIKFDGGDGATGGPILPMLKVQNTTLTLPPNTYSKAGYSFKNWLGGTTGLYTDGGNYAANASDTLTAQWSNDQFSFRVNYFFMGTDGEYKATEDAFSTFVAAHGTIISTKTSAIQVARTGMILDESKSSSITVTGAGQSINVYYTRSKHTITYSYQEPGKTGLTTATKTYFYGADVPEQAKPTLDGYTFVGWLYGEAGQKPATMPNQSITATGSFSPLPATYIVSYYEKDLIGEGYTLNSTMTETRNARHAEKITFQTSNAKQIEGFSIQGVTTTVGTAGGGTPTTPPTDKSFEGVVSAIAGQTLYVNYYYTRNKYILTLNVWKGARDDEKNRLYTTGGLWELTYGAPITPEAATNYANYEKDKWTEGKDVAGYALAEYADWSTGTVPASMPAGNITVSRDYVSTTSSSYQLEIYYEGDDGSYPIDNPSVSLTYYADKGKTVTVGKSTDSPKPDISYDQFGSSLDEIAYYTYTPYRDEVKSGTVTDVPGGDAPLVLKIYFERKTVGITVNYYYSSGNERKLIGTLKQTGTWGTQYDAFKPLAFFKGGGVPQDSWGTDYKSNNETINGTPAESYDFQANSYVASYSGRYELRTKRSWPNKRYDSVDSLTEDLVTGDGKNEIPIFGDSNEGSTPAYIDVYYTEVNRNNYALDVAYATYMLNKSPEKIKGETSQSHTKFPLTKTLEDGQEYTVRVANKADVFNATFVPASDTSGYPGLGVLNGTYTYDGGLRAGFTAVELSRPDAPAQKSTYYTKTEGGKNYLYVIDEENQFFAGNRTSYSFLKDPLNNARPGYDVVETYLATYKTEHGNPENPDAYDDNVDGALLYDGGFSSIIFDATKPTYYTLSFEYLAAYQVTYDLGGTTCTDRTHKYVTGSKVENPGCSHTGVFAPRDGYKITWYQDGTYTTPATAFVINGPTTLYGRYEKITRDGHEYIHYQLADVLKVDGKDISYITAENVGKITDPKLKNSITTKDIQFVDGAGKTSTHQIKTTTYTYDEQTVLIDKSYPVLTFTPIEMTQPAAPEGFYYDTTNAGNRLLGYCQSEAVPLAVYFARNEHAVTMVPNDAKVSNSTTTNYRFGQTVALTAPTKGGYTFAGWEWYKWKGAADAEDVPGNWTEWTPNPAGADGTTSFVMPALRLKAEAKWAPAAFDQPITHYFQGSSQTYETELLKALKGTDLTTATKTVTFKGASYPATVYSKDGAVLGLSLQFESYTAWFPGKSIGGKESITLEATDLIAMETTVKLTSEVITQVESLKIPDDKFDMFNHSFTVYQSDTAVETLDKEGEFTNQYGMQVDYYYTRQSDYNIRTVAKAQDGGVPGATLAGSSTHYYGESVTLTANLLSGYDIVGWYKAADVLDGYTPDMTDLSTCPLKENITAPPLSTTARYALSVIEALDLVVVTEPQAVDLPTVTISGRNNYIYGYAASPTNALKAEITMKPDGSSATYIAGYQWYQNNTVITGATSSTYLFPTGQAAGSYQYTCEVTVGRKDNGRTKTVTTAVYPVTVTQGTMELESTGYSATYDGNLHGISVKVKTPEDAGTYTVYYADKVLTADNLDEIGKTENPLYKDVAVNPLGETVSRTVYYYVRSTDKNFVDMAGSSTVTIRPITLSIKASRAYSKEFDGEAKISGAVNTAGTGKYELAHGGYYTVSGMLAGQAEGHLVDFDAEFNTKDVVGSSYVTMSKMKMVDKATGENINYNYTFPQSSTLTLSGFIEQFSLAVSWSTDNEFTYNGTLQAPTVKLNPGQNPPDAAVALSVTGMQTNVGNYTAYAAVEPSDAYETSNYSFTAGGSCAFEITKRPLTITPVGKTATYDRLPKTLEEFTAPELVAGQKCSASTKSVTNAGTHTITAQNDAQITTADGKLVTYNYDITYGTGTLQINPKPVTIRGITAANKAYDGTAEATLNLAGVAFDGLIAGDTLALNPDKISGSFDTADAGTGKTVTLTKQDGLLGGVSAANYTLLDWTPQSTTADITAAGVVVTAQSVETVYGEAAPFAVTYSPSPNIAVTGNPIYKVRKSGATGAFEVYDPTHHGAGSYDIQLDTTGLSADNYTFAPDSAPATLTVKPRPIEVRAFPGAKISKVYDASTAATVTSAHYAFVGIAGDSQSGLVNNNTLTLEAGYAAAYNSKDVDTAATVTVSGLAIADDNYELQNDTFSLDGEITAKRLTVTADDKETTYGESAPAFTATYTGLVGGETAAALSGDLTFICTYDIDDAANRDAKIYTITPAGYANGNYVITYDDGTLTVNKAVIKVTADDKKYTYRGTEPLPTYTGVLSGFQYGETEATVVTGTPSYSCPAVVGDVAGEYDITPNVSGLTADNYTFEPVKGTLTVDRNIITISGITVENKKYDGTTAATAITTGVIYKDIKPEDVYKQGIVVEAATFDNATVGNGKTVNLTFTLNDYLAQRYSLAPESRKTATADITEQALTVKAVDTSVVYGAVPPTYTVTYSGFVNGETASVLGGTLTFNAPYEANSNTGVYTEVGTYTNTNAITPSGYTSVNYTITHAPGTLTVTQAKLATPSPKWSTTNAGTVTWEAVPKIGNVDVSGYKLELFQSGTTVAVHTKENIAPDARSVDLLEIIRSKGAGAYTVKVTAIASSTNNAGNKNVADSTAGTSVAIYAAPASVKFADNAGGTGKPTIKGAETYTVVQGEKDLPIAATLKNATGYTVQQPTSNNTKVTVAAGTLTGINYTTTAAVGAITSASPIEITLTLNATPATIMASVTADKSEVDFGYKSEDAPKLTANPDPAAGDNIGKSEYTYTYQWRLKKGLASAGDIEGATSPQLTFPPNQTGGKYSVSCEITATRNDNGQSKKLTPSPATTITINPSSLSSTVSLAGWTYGEARNIPSVDKNPDNSTVTYTYSKDNSTWETVMPTDVGSYYVRATIAESTNYKETTTLSVPFTIAQATLTTPTELKMEASSTAPYGKATWKAVAGPKENAGTNSASSVGVTYTIKLYHKEDGSVKTYKGSECAYDFTSDIGDTGIYTFTVTAVSNNQTNCADSAESAASTELNVSGQIAAPGDLFEKEYDGKGIPLTAECNTGTPTAYQWYRNDTAIEGATSATYHVTYVEQSGNYSCNITVGSVINSSMHRQVTITPRAIKITSPDATKAYDGAPLSKQNWGQTGMVAGEVVECTLSASITNVGNTANTIGAVTIKAGEKIVYADHAANNNYTVERTEGRLTVTAKGLDTAGITVSEPMKKTYDGTQQKPGVTVTHQQNTPVTLTAGTDYTIAYGANINAGSGSVTFTGKGNYTGSVTKQFTIDQRAITVTSKDITKPYDGTALESTALTDLTATNLATGDQLTSVTFTGSQTEVGSSSNTFENVVIENAGNTNVTANYAITPHYGSIKIAPTKDTVVITGDPSKAYDGTPVSNPTVTKNGTGAVTFQYYTKTDSDYTLLADAPKDAGDYYVKALVAASDNYSASESDYKAFTVTKRALTITPDDQTSVYGKPLAALTYTTSPDRIAADDALNIMLTITATSTPAVGIYPITVSTDATASRNYIITPQKGKYSITEATINVVASGYRGAYDRAAHGITVNAPAGATVKYRTAATGSYDLTESPTYTNVGTYTVYYFVSAPNHLDASGSQTVEITRAAQAITVSDVTAAYDGEPHAVTATTSGDGAVTYVGNSPIKAGTHTVTIHASETTNYAAATKTATVTISPRPLTILANSDTKTYDGTALTANGYTIKAGSLANGDVIDTVTVTGSQTDAGTGSNTPSAAAIQASGDDRAQSYAITYLAGELVVTKAPQAAPTDLTGHNETIETKGDGSIGGIKSGMEYRKSGETAYTAVTAQMVTDGAISGLTSGVYEVRYAQTRNYFASTPTEVTIGFDTAAVYALTLTAPAFAELTEGYAQPQAEPLTITSTGNAAATIVSVTSSDPAFEITGSGSTVPVDGTLTSYGVRPATGLAAGSYKAKITVTYNNRATATDEVAVEVKPNPVSPPSGGDGGSGNTSSSRPPVNPELPAVQPPAVQPPGNIEPPVGQMPGNMEPPAGQPPVAPDAEDTVEQASSVPVSQTPDGIINAALEDKKVVVQETLPFGSGSIHVTVDCIETEQRRVEAALVSSQQVVNACLSEQEKQAVVNGDSIEIRLTVKLCQTEVPLTDAELITRQVETLQSEISGLTFGDYVDISLDKRLNGGNWKRITQTDGDIAIEIAIPEWLQFPNTDYFISRAHNGGVTLLDDTDNDPQTITIPTQYFSTYAILYTATAVTEQAPDCIWHILMLVVLAGYLLLIFIGKPRKNRGLLLAGVIVLFALAAALGTCAWDWPVALLSTAAAAAAVACRSKNAASKNQ